MSYREQPCAPPVMCDVITASGLHVLNGVIAEFSIPCSYVVPLNDGTDDTQLVPVLLRTEGYSEPIMAVDVIPEGLTWATWIDAEDESVIKLVISAQCPEAVDEKISCDIAVLITRTTPEYGDRTDAVLRGVLDIEASPLPGIAPVLADMAVTSAIRVTANPVDFGGVLTSEDTTVQQALDRLDDHTHAAVDHTHENIVHTHDFDMTPPGVVTAYGGAAAPTGWLLCDGAAVSRTTEAALFAAIGTAYGAGDGSTTFNLPMLRGRIPVGRDSGQTEFDTLGESGGAKLHRLTTAEIPAHTHLIDLAGTASGTTGTKPARATGTLYPNYTVTGPGSGGGDQHNNLQPYLVMNYIIKK